MWSEKLTWFFCKDMLILGDKAFNNRRPVQLLLEGETETLAGKPLIRFTDQTYSKCFKPKKYINLTGFNCYLSLSDLHDLKYDLKIIVDGVITETKAFP